MSTQVQIEVRQVSATTSEAVARQHKVLSDRPEAKGGQDQGPMGGELLLMGLGGCFMSNLLAAAAARKAKIENVKVSISDRLEAAPRRF